METSEVTAGECIRPHIVNARDMLGFMLKTKMRFKKKKHRSRCDRRGSLADRLFRAITTAMLSNLNTILCLCQV